MRRQFTHKSKSKLTSVLLTGYCVIVCVVLGSLIAQYGRVLNPVKNKQDCLPGTNYPIEKRCEYLA